MLSNGQVRFGERAEETRRLERSVARLGPTPRRFLSHQTAGAQGQSTARQVAGAQGSGVQRGQDACRLPRGRSGLSGIQRPPLSRQAADQTEQAGGQTDPGTTPVRTPCPSGPQCEGRGPQAQPDHSGLGQLLPDTRSRRDLRQAGWLPVAAHMEVGQVQPREQVGVLGVRPVLRQVQQGQARPVGVR